MISRSVGRGLARLVMRMLFLTHYLFPAGRAPAMRVCLAKLEDAAGGRTLSA
jgi:hypothetical protein